MIQEITTLDGLRTALAEQEHAVVDFAAPDWCVPCQKFAPHYEAVSEVVEGFTFVHVDIDKADKDLVEFYSVQSVPTVLAFRDGEVIEFIDKAFHTAPKLTRKLNSLFKE